MDTATILHVGEDICYRIPVMEMAGLEVRRAPCTVEGLRSALAENEHFTSLAFEVETGPVPEPVLSVARSQSSPLVLFENPTTECLADAFDLVIPHHTPPEVWLQCLRLAVAHAREQRDVSRQLREEAAAARSNSEQLREKVHRMLGSSVDLDRIWRMGPEGAGAASVRSDRPVKRA
jgi:hypothetical protein